MSTQVQQLRSQANAEIARALDGINQELEGIAELNAQIANNLTQNLPVGDLQDRRDVAVKTISGYMGLQEFTDATGQIRLFTQSGRSLVSGVSVSSLSYTTTPYMTANETYLDPTTGNTINTTKAQ